MIPMFPTRREIQQELDTLLEPTRNPEFSETLTSLAESLVTTATQIEPKRTQIGSWTRLSSALGGGLREHEFSILCGPTGCGKTTLLANLAAQLISNLIPVFIASVEVGKEDFIRKMISVVTREPFSASSAEEGLRKINLLGRAFLSKQTVLTNYESRIDHKHLLGDLLYAHKVHGTKVALIDNLNFLLKVTRAQDSIIEMDTAVHDFVVFCKKIPMHVIMVMHPRKVEKDGRIISEQDIKGSATAVQEASNVLLFNRILEEDAIQSTPAQFSREIYFAKVRRNGRAVGSKLFLHLDKNSERYEEGAMK